MSTPPNGVLAPPQLDEVSMSLPAHLLANFEKAESQLRETYGVTPGVPALVRLWLSCGTSSRIRQEFEQAVLEIESPALLNHDDDCDGDDE